RRFLVRCAHFSGCDPGMPSCPDAEAMAIRIGLMMNRIALVSFFAPALALITGVHAAAGNERPVPQSPTGAKTARIEPWADAKLPVRDGLELWLDASRAWGDKIAPFDGKLAEWLDASGNGRHLRQASESARPTRLPAGDVAVVRFDGIKEHLRAVK